MAQGTQREIVKRGYRSNVAFCLVKRWLLSLLFITCCGQALLAQLFNISKVELDVDKIHIHYNLMDTVKNRNYTIFVYSSNDNYLNPLQKISGDAGINIAPGFNKKITWNAKEELGANFTGSVGLEIRGKLYTPFVRFAGFEDYTARKRGVPFVLNWSGGTRQNVLNIELYKNKQAVWAFPPVGNLGSAEITIPSDVKPGKGYYFKISDSKNKDEVVFTGEFQVKRKIPLALKALPTLVIAGAAYLLYQSLIEPPPPKEIVNPICPEGDNSCNQ